MRRRAGRRRAPLAALALGAAAASGAGGTPTGRELTVTRDFGADRPQRATARRSRGSDTVMRAARAQRQGHDPLRRRLRAVDRRPRRRRSAAAARSTGSSTSTAIEAAPGPRRRELHAGRPRLVGPPRLGRDAMPIPAVVGSFPEPFLHGTGGKRLPVRIECIDPRGPACAPVSSA